MLIKPIEAVIPVIAKPIGLLIAIKTFANPPTAVDVDVVAPIATPNALLNVPSIFITVPIPLPNLPKIVSTGPIAIKMPPIVKIVCLDLSSNSEKAFAQSVIFSITFVTSGNNVLVNSP